MVLAGVFITYQIGNIGLQLVERVSWIEFSLGSWGTFRAEYLLGVDGLSLPLVALSVVVMLVAVIASWHASHQVKGYFVLLLILNAAVIGSFTALDMLLFYLFFEFMLLPMYFLIGIWGGPNREYASIKFFLYTLLGSIFILIVIIGLYLCSAVPTGSGVTHTFSLIDLAAGNLEPGSLLNINSSWQLAGYSARAWAFLLLFVGFSIKLPMVPLHTWLPDAHVEASTPISVILAALLLKIGAYGLLRMAYPLFPEAAVQFSTLVAFMGMLSILYGALNALASKDLKRLIAYSSVSHMGFVLLGMAAGTTEALSGAMFQLTSHGLISAMLFLIAGVLYDRTHDRLIGNYSGLAAKMPRYTAAVLVAFLATMGLPGFSGFIGEVMVFLGTFRSTLVPTWITALAVGGLILSAAYCLWLIQRMFFGVFIQKAEGILKDLSAREVLLFVVLGAGVVVLGVFPQVLIQYVSEAANLLSERIDSFLP
jgi:NADH-quinone oxidoreductase subunit M